MEKETVIVFMAGGVSSRFGGRIKALVEVGPQRESLIEISMQRAIRTGFDKIIFIVSDKTESAFRENFGNSYQNTPILYAKQEYDIIKRDKPWGTADAVCSIKDVVDCPFVVCNSDELYGEGAFRILRKHLRENNDNVTLGFRLIDVLPDEGLGNRALFKIENNYVKSIDEIYGIGKENLEEKSLKKDDLVSLNIYGLQLETLWFLVERVEHFKREKQGNRKIESLVQHEISNLIKEEKIKMRIYPCHEKWLGVTYPGDEEGVRKELMKINTILS